MKTLLTKRILVLALIATPLALGCGDDDSGDENQGGAGTSGAGSSGEGGASGTAGTGSEAGMGSEAGTGSEAGMGGEAGMGTAGMGEAGMGGGEAMDIIDTAIAAGDFTMLASALESADLVDALRGDGPFTVFAPTDAAFEAFEEANPGVLDGLSTEALTEILTYHVISGAAVMSTDLQDGQLAATLAGPVVAIDLNDGVKVNDASVTTADIEATNGVIHVIDSILLPPGDIVEVATAAGSFTTLASALGDAGLVETLQGEGPFTVFAPTDDAFAAFEDANPGVIASLSSEELAAVLTYHVVAGIAGPLDLVDGGAVATVSGSPVLFDLSEGAGLTGGDGTSAKITTTNVVAKNGVIHVIDAVILPPSMDIVETAVDAGFDTLADLLTSQDLVDDLQAPGPFTVFAPTDDAFAALTEVPQGDALTNVLLYHVLDGLVGSGNLADGAVEMLSGDSVTVDLSDGVKVDDANVTTPNILTKNGIIHVVDAVLVP